MPIDRGVRQILIETAVRGGLAVALFGAFPPFSDMHRLWQRAAGLVEWPDVFEYPPAAALYVEPFLHLPSARWAVVLNGVVMVMAAVITTYLLATMAPEDERPRDLRVWVASPALLVFLPVNWDVLVVLVSVVAAMSLVRGRHAQVGLFAGLGTVLKLFPCTMVLPFLPLIEGWRQRAKYLAAGFVSVAIPYLLFAWLEPGWRFHLHFASLRTDIDFAVWGPLVRIFGALGTETSVETVNLVSTVCLVVALVAITVWALLRRPTVGQAAALTMLAVLFLIKVFKPQYVLWALPFLAWTGARRLPVRLLETTAIVQFATTYFALPVAAFALVLTPIRLFAIAWLARDLLSTTKGGRVRGEARAAAA